MFCRDREHLFHNMKYNYRIAGSLSLKGLWGSSGPTPWLKHSHQELFASDHAQTAVECLQGWRLHRALVYSHSDRTISLYLGRLSMFPSVSISFCLINGSHWKEVLLISFTLSGTDEILKSLLFSRLKNPSSASLSS